MAELAIEQLHKSYGGKVAVASMDLKIPTGTFCIFFGAVGLRKINDAELRRGPRGADFWPDFARWPRYHEPATSPTRHCDGVPVGASLSASGRRTTTSG